jgi:glutathione synthase/RimK-type ligase-like ATP-grasp enzyme
MIVIFSEHHDVHALAVQSCLVRQLNKDAVILNVADYPTRWNIDLYVGAHDEYKIKTQETTISSAEVEGVWRRRIQPHAIHEAVSDPEVRHFCFSEAYSFFAGLIGNVTNVINTENSDLLASRKAYQLKAAKDIGLRIPDTLISSDPEEVKKFYECHHGNVIFKELTSTNFQFSETRLLEEHHLEFLGSAVFAPTIYQERINPRLHLRITIVDDELFCASIESEQEYAVSDWRLDPNPVIRAVETPPELGASLLELMRRLGIRYGAVDMVIGRDGECYFLEVNPGGQFLFVEIQTDQPISLALANAVSSKR